MKSGKSWRVRGTRVARSAPPPIPRRVAEQFVGLLQGPRRCATHTPTATTGTRIPSIRSGLIGTPAALAAFPA
ncbi:hypothetical protein FG94_03204 [Massilia sp. LC238]|nr:hypothetical protein FG94_03204 [Massilia sp. LC238]